MSDRMWQKVERPFTMRPLGEKVIIKWEEPPKAVGKILLPESAKQTKYLATLVDIGPEVTKAKDADIGKTVVTQLFTAEVTLQDAQGVLWTVMDQGSILAVLEFGDEKKK